VKTAEYPTKEIVMERYDTLLDAASRILRRGYRFDFTFEDRFGNVEHHFSRDSWSCSIKVQKNGRACVRQW
jgi:hypothetical protein